MKCLNVVINMKRDDYLPKIKELTKASNNTLAIALGVSISTITHWRKCGVPWFRREMVENIYLKIIKGELVLKSITSRSSMYESKKVSI